MNKLVIQEHKQEFWEVKEGPKRFSEKNDRDFRLPSVEEKSGPFEMFSHSVTGEELNERLKIVQDILIGMNRDIIENRKELRQVYDVLKALNSKYSQEILVAVKSAEKAITEVRSAEDGIRYIRDYQKKTLEILQEFKNRVESYEHLPDIDSLWEEVISIQQELAETKAEIQRVRECVETRQMPSRNMRHLALFGYCVGAVAVVELVLFFLKGF